jgi:hypothetical protein
MELLGAAKKRSKRTRRLAAYTRSLAIKVKPPKPPKAKASR